MKIKNDSTKTKLHPELMTILNKYRKMRNFDPQQYLDVKAKVITEYFTKWNIGGVVFGLSGGVDSAVVLAMFNYIATNKPNSKLQSIVPSLMPYVDVKVGVSGQKEGYMRAERYVNSINPTYVKPQYIDLSKPLKAMIAQFKHSEFNNNDPWTVGQLITNLRTPAFYHLATLMSQKTEMLHVVSGTTNLDEASHIGYFAKVGDCMVDIQPLTDLHKSEVYTLARYLNVDPAIIDLEPKGDVHDNRTDLEMIGTDYDFVELHHYLSGLGNHEELINQLSREALEQFYVLVERINNLHHLNAHKYLKKPSYITFDVMDKDDYEDLVSFYPEKPNFDSTKLNSFITKPFGGLKKEFLIFPFPNPRTNYNESIISEGDCQSLIEYFESVPLVPVSNNGYQEKIKSKVVNNNSAFRSTCYDTELAQDLFAKLQGKINMYYEVSEDYANFLHMPAGQYLAVGLNPMLRYIKYFQGGALVPHYDTEHNFGDNKHITLQSAIFYLTSQHKTGLTRFIKDKYVGQKYTENKFLDWINVANESDVEYSVKANAGSVLTFDHRILHDSSTFQSVDKSMKAVFRTDIVYRYLG